MCRSVYIDGEEFDSIGSLRRRLGTIVGYDRNEPEADETCLCVLNVNATASLHGFRVAEDPFDWYFVREDQDKPSGTRWR